MFIPAAGSPLSSLAPPRQGQVPRPPGILADRWEPIDPADSTKGFDISALDEGDDPTDAAIGWQFMIRQGSGAALGTNGNRLHTITKATDGAAVQLADEGKRVMRKFEQRGDVRAVTVQAEVIGDSTATGAIVVACKNVHTDQSLITKGGA